MTRRTLFSLAAGALLVGTLTACVGSQTSNYEGSYIGSGGSVLSLEKDGIAVFAHPKTQSNSGEAHVGEWTIEDNRLTVDTDALDYELFADISKNPDALLLKSDSDRWNDELFTKN